MNKNLFLIGLFCIILIACIKHKGFDSSILKEITINKEFKFNSQKSDSLFIDINSDGSNDIKIHALAENIINGTIYIHQYLVDIFVVNPTYQIATDSAKFFLCTDATDCTRICTNSFSMDTITLSITKPHISTSTETRNKFTFSKIKSSLRTDVNIDWDYLGGGSLTQYEVGDFKTNTQTGYFVLNTIVGSSSVIKFVEFTYDGKSLFIKSVKSFLQ